MSDLERELRSKIKMLVATHQGHIGENPSFEEETGRLVSEDGYYAFYKNVAQAGYFLERIA